MSYERAMDPTPLKKKKRIPDPADKWVTESDESLAAALREAARRVARRPSEPEQS